MRSGLLVSEKIRCILTHLESPPVANDARLISAFNHVDGLGISGARPLVSLVNNSRWNRTGPGLSHRFFFVLNAGQLFISSGLDYIRRVF